MGPARKSGAVHASNASLLSAGNKVLKHHRLRAHKLNRMVVDVT